MLDSRPTLRLRSSAFRSGGRIPARFTCEGAGDSPPLAWGDVPDGTGQLAIVMRDLDAPPFARVHWALAELPPTPRRVAAGRAPARATRLANHFGTRGYRGPCPRKRSAPHRYLFTLYALSSRPQLSPDSPPAEAEDAIREAAQASATLLGRYSR
jgi:Raf kinase inhibitor-like YbhB/YbcL family protein